MAAAPEKDRQERTNEGAQERTNEGARERPNEAARERPNGASRELANEAARERPNQPARQRAGEASRSRASAKGHARPKGESANERFKRRSNGWYWPALVCAVALHALFFALAPAMDVRGGGKDDPGRDALRAIRLPVVDLPTPPERIPVPAVPVIAPAEPAFNDLTIDPVTFENYGVEIPPLPVADHASALREFRQWVPSMVKPELRNPEAVRRALAERYPAHLAMAGIGARVVIWFWIDETGTVKRYEIKKSSGYDALDAVAVDVIEMMEFSPALNGGKAVPVMVALPIRFQAP